MEVCEIVLLEFVELFRVEQTGFTVVGFKFVSVASWYLAVETETVFGSHDEVPIADRDGEAMSWIWGVNAHGVYQRISGVPAASMSNACGQVNTPDVKVPFCAR